MRISDRLVAQCWPSASNPHAFICAGDQETTRLQTLAFTAYPSRLRCPLVVHLASEHIHTRVMPLPVYRTLGLALLEGLTRVSRSAPPSSKVCDKPRGVEDHSSDLHPPYNSKGRPQPLSRPRRGLGVQTVSTKSRFALFHIERQGISRKVPLYKSR